MPGSNSKHSGARVAGYKQVMDAGMPLQRVVDNRNSFGTLAGAGEGNPKIIAARHEKWMERPLLLVVPKPGRQIDTESVLALYSGAVARWWLPDAVVVVEELPHTATGKLNKVALRRRYEDHLLAERATEG